MGKFKKLHLLWIIPLAVIILSVVLSCFYTVGETENAVVTTFGKVSSIHSAGLQFKLPFPIQSVKKVDMTTRKLMLGYYEDSSGVTVKTDEAQMITGDYNVVSVDFFIEWKVSDPQKFLYQSQNPTEIFKYVAQAAARDIMGSKTVDDVLTTGKAEIQAGIKELITQKLDLYDIGIQVMNVKIQDAEPPTEDVIAAFKEVETAKQQMETAINQAKAYENSVIPNAQAEADKVIRAAEAYKEQRINEATGSAAKFAEMYKEYSLNPDVTKKRMYWEMLEEVLPGVDLYIDAGGTTQKLLPMESFSPGQTTAGETPTAENNADNP